MRQICGKPFFCLLLIFLLFQVCLWLWVLKEKKKGGILIGDFNARLFFFLFPLFPPCDMPLSPRKKTVKRILGLFFSNTLFGDGKSCLNIRIFGRKSKLHPGLNVIFYIKNLVWFYLGRKNFLFRLLFWNWMWAFIFNLLRWFCWAYIQEQE